METSGSLRRRVLGVQLLNLLAFVGVLVASLIAMRQAGNELELVTRGTVPLANVTARMQSIDMPAGSVRRLLVDSRALTVHREARERAVERTEARLAEASRVLVGIEDRMSRRRTRAAYHSLERELDLVRAHWERLRDSETELMALVESTAAAMEESSGASEDTSGREKLEQMRRRLFSSERRTLTMRAEYSAQLDSMAQLLDRRLAGALGRARSLQRRGTLLLAALGILAAALAMLTLSWLSRSLAPLSKLLEQVGHLAAGRYDRLESAPGGGELAALSRELVTTADALAEREERLRRAERLAGVGELAAQITHEIRNPLNALAMNAELLAEEPDAPDAAELWQAVRAEIDRLSNITETYLQLARLPSGEHLPLSLTDLLDELLVLLGAEIARGGIVVSKSWPAGSVLVPGDSEQLRRALMNLVQNSLAAMESGGRLDLTATVRGNEVELRIQDSGSGIAPEDLPRIFDPFYSRREGGTGLGLAIAERIIDDHGGKLRLESAPGRGTVAVLSLPRAEGAA